MDGLQSGPEFIASPKNNLLFHSQYAKICSMIVKKLYSPTARSSSAFLEENQYYLKSLLDEWQRSGKAGDAGWNDDNVNVDPHLARRKNCLTAPAAQFNASVFRGNVHPISTVSTLARV